MSYHPLMGITIFFIFIIMAFILENKSIFKFRQKRKTVWDLK